jgi:hypothetical protein
MIEPMYLRHVLVQTWVEDREPLSSGTLNLETHSKPCESDVSFHGWAKMGRMETSRCWHRFAKRKKAEASPHLSPRSSAAVSSHEHDLIIDCSLVA